MQVKLYVASPLGFSEVGRFFYKEKILPMLREIGFTILDPWDLTSEEVLLKAEAAPEGPERREAWTQANHIMGTNNTKALGECHLMLAILDGTDVDSGTASEIGFVTARGTQVIGYRNDFRMSGDNPGAIVNLQVEHFINLSGGKIVRHFEELRTALQDAKEEVTAREAA